MQGTDDGSVEIDLSMEDSQSQGPDSYSSLPGQNLILPSNHSASQAPIKSGFDGEQQNNPRKRKVEAAGAGKGACAGYHLKEGPQGLGYYRKNGGSNASQADMTMNQDMVKEHNEAPIVNPIEYELVVEVPSAVLRAGSAGGLQLRTAVDPRGKHGATVLEVAAAPHQEELTKGPPPAKVRRPNLRLGLRVVPGEHWRHGVYSPKRFPGEVVGFWAGQRKEGETQGLLQPGLAWVQWGVSSGGEDSQRSIHRVGAEGMFDLAIDPEEAREGASAGSLLPPASPSGAATAKQQNLSNTKGTPELGKTTQEQLLEGDHLLAVNGAAVATLGDVARALGPPPVGGGDARSARLKLRRRLRRLDWSADRYVAQLRLLTGSRETFAFPRPGEAPGPGAAWYLGRRRGGAAASSAGAGAGAAAAPPADLLVDLARYEGARAAGGREAAAGGAGAERLVRLQFAAGGALVLTCLDPSGDVTFSDVAAEGGGAERATLLAGDARRLRRGARIVVGRLVFEVAEIRRHDPAPLRRQGVAGGVLDAMLRSPSAGATSVTSSGSSINSNSMSKAKSEGPQQAAMAAVVTAPRVESHASIATTSRVLMKAEDDNVGGKLQASTKASSVAIGVEDGGGKMPAGPAIIVDSDDDWDEDRGYQYVSDESGALARGSTVGGGGQLPQPPGPTSPVGIGLPDSFARRVHGAVLQGLRAAMGGQHGEARLAGAAGAALAASAGQLATWGEGGGGGGDPAAGFAKAQEAVMNRALDLLLAAPPAAGPPRKAPTPPDPRLQIMAMFPDILPSFVTEELRTKPVNQVIDELADRAAGGQGYPTAQGEAARAAREAAARQEPEVDYKNVQELPEHPAHSPYVKEATELLLYEFKMLQKTGIVAAMRRFRNRYYPTKVFIRQLLEGDETGLDARLQQHKIRKMKVDRIDKRSFIQKAIQDKELRREHSFSLQEDEKLQKEKDLKLEEERKEQDRKLAEEKLIEEATKAGALLECGVCYGEVPIEFMVQCADGHLFCKDCLKKYAQEQLFGQGKTSLVCMNMTEKCEMTFPDDQLQAALPEKVFLKYQEAAARAAVEAAALADLVACPFCQFAAALPPEMKVFACPNPECKKESCRLCQKESHIPLRCDEVAEQEKDQKRLTVEEAMTEARVRECPKCKTRFFKVEGCNKMTCSKCQTKTCYICRKVVKDYAHFCQAFNCQHTSCGKCRLYSNTEEDDILAMKEAGLKAKEQAGAADVDITGLLEEAKAAPASAGGGQQVAAPAVAAAAGPQPGHPLPQRHAVIIPDPNEQRRLLMEQMERLMAARYPNQRQLQPYREMLQARYQRLRNLVQQEDERRLHRQGGRGRRGR